MSAANPMTFQAAREKQLARIDMALQNMSKALATPGLCNKEYKALTEAREELESAVDALFRINEAENIAKG